MMRAWFESVHLPSNSAMSCHKRKGTYICSHIYEAAIRGQKAFKKQDYSLIGFLKALPEYLGLDVVGKGGEDPDILVESRFQFHGGNCVSKFISKLQYQPPCGML
ncbi:hypothetical protein SAMN05216411_101313 [Nitrosospira multiformis]|nr:hypothetical protein [Nitrosospira multiformis]SDZ77059.1 hypothetical protein SAMN05216411_101313 [Nitrosospira multiformis]